MDQKQDSNNVGLFVARETTNRTLPDPAAFDTREPNSFDDFGGDYKSVARRPFNPSRQRKKGTIVDLDANGGWNEDLTQNNMRSVFEGFCFAAERRKAHAENVAAVAASDDYTVASSAGFLVGSIVLGKGFDNAPNNGIHVLNGITDATHISTADPLTDEAASPLQTVEVVGYQFPAGDVVATLVGGHYILTSATINMTTLGLIPGEWTFNGGDAGGNQLAANQVGFARVYSVSATQIVFDKTTFAAAAADGVGTTLRIFFGTVIKNEDDPDDIVKYTHTVERTLGRDDDGRQSEYIDGYVFNELTWNSPLTDKVSVDIKGVGMSHTTRTGAEGPISEDGTNTIAAALSEDAFNTSSNIYRLRMAVLDRRRLTRRRCSLAFPSSARRSTTTCRARRRKVRLARSTVRRAASTWTMEVTAYFSGVGSVASIRANEDVTFDAIYSKQNAAIILDVPLDPKRRRAAQRRYG
jgi:hypothetical protein